MSCGLNGRFDRACGLSRLILTLAVSLSLNAHAQGSSLGAGAEVVTAEGSSALLPLKGSAVPLRKGMSPKPGDRIRTSADSNVVLRYPDGSEVILGKSSEIGFLNNSDSTQRMLIRNGGVRGLIQKKAEDIRKKPGFYFRTKSAVMGVRGTDFVFYFDSGLSKTEVHTLEGSVEVAKNEEIIEQAKGTRVAENQTLSVDLSGFSKVRTFDKQAYIATLYQADPFMGKATGHANAETERIDANGLHLRRFQLGLIRTMDPRLPASHLPAGPELAWTPQLRIGRFLGFRGHLGVSYTTYVADTWSIQGFDYHSAYENFALTAAGAGFDLTPFAGFTLGFTGLVRHVLNPGGRKIDAFLFPTMHLAWRFGPNTLIDRVLLSIGEARMHTELGDENLSIDFGEFRLGIGFRL